MIKRLVNSRFARNVALVATGTAGAQAITMAFSPVLTRLYGPEAFGLLGTFTATLAIVTPIAALAYPIAIVLPKEDDDARGIAGLSILLSLIISLLLACSLLVARQSIASLLHLNAIAPYLLLIPAAMFFNTLQQVMRQWLIRKKQFKVSARIAITQALLLNCAFTGAGLAYPAGTTLMVLATLGHALYATQLWLGAAKWTSIEQQIHKPSKKTPPLKKLALQHKDFPFYRAPQVAINAFSQSLPVLLLASFFGPKIAGFYTLSRVSIAAPANLLGNSIGNVFYAQIAESVNQGKSPRPYLLKATFAAFAIASIPFLIIMVWGQPIFSFVFGEKWHTAGQYAQWIAIWLLFSLAARPLIATIPVIGIQGHFLIAEIAFTGLKVAGFLLGAVIYSNPLYAISFYSIVSALFYIFLFLMVLTKMENFSKAY